MSQDEYDNGFLGLPYGSVEEDSPRAADWLAAFGALEVPLRSPIPSPCQGPDGVVEHVYYVDVNRLRPEQRLGVIKHIAATRDLPILEVAAQVDENNIPVLIEGVSVTFRPRSRT